MAVILPQVDRDTRAVAFILPHMTFLDIFVKKIKMSITCPYEPPKMYIHLVQYFWAIMPYKGLPSPWAADA